MREQSNTTFLHVNKKYGYISKLITDDNLQIEACLDLEQRVWISKGYGSLENYHKYRGQSRFFGAFTDDTTVGMCRVFKGGPHPPHF